MDLLIKSMVDDGDVAILWLGGDADRGEMVGLLGVEGAHELPVPLPVSLVIHRCEHNEADHGWY
jgi:hypothetical protein